MKRIHRKMLYRTPRVLVLAALLWAGASGAQDDSAAVVDAVAGQFVRSALSAAELRTELRWFRQTARPLAARLGGAEIRSCSEPLPVHEYERDVLAPLFHKLTGIKVRHDLLHEGEVVNRFSKQISTGRRIYHDFILDADNLGLVTRSGKVVCLSDFMAGEGKAFTSPRLDLEDFLNLKAVQDYDGRIYQLPDQSFPILYWYRTDWFADRRTQADFKKRFNRELAVPKTWAEYEEIAAFFKGRKMKNPDGKTVSAYGHLDYYRVDDLSLGWRIADVQLGNAGVGDPGLPNGLPVDEYGIRVLHGVPVGASVNRGGALDSPAAVYALRKYLDWRQYAPPEAQQMNWHDMARALGKGDVAQTIYFCSVFMNFVPSFTTPGPLCRRDGRPVWRMVPQPRGKFWQQGMKIGYKDIGAHTICTNVRHDYRLAAWLWAQFCTSKIAAVAKFEKGVTPVRRSTLKHPWTQANAYRWGGLVEFYLSDIQHAFTDTGLNVPHYPAIAALWYEHVKMAVEGVPPETVMQRLAAAVDDVMSRIRLPHRSPKLNPRMPRKYWLEKPGAPKKDPDRSIADVPLADRPPAVPGNGREILVVCAERFPDAYRRNNEVRGIQADFVAHALSDAGFQPNIRILPIRRCLQLIRTGAADAMFPVYESKDLADLVRCHPAPPAEEPAEHRRWHRSWRIMTQDHVVVTPAARTTPKDEYRGRLAALPEPVRVVHGDPFTAAIRAAGRQAEAVATDIQNVRKLLRDRTGCAILPSFVAEEVAGLPAFRGKLYIHDRPLSSRPTFLGFSRRASRLTAADRLKIWEHLQARARDHVAVNVAYATASQAAAMLDRE